MKRRLLAALLILPAPVLAADEPSPRIMVSGNGSVSTPPDTAVIGYSVRGEGTTSDEAVAALAARRKAIDSGVASLGPAEPRAGEMQVLEVRGRDCFNANNGNRPRLSTGECAVTGYVATLTIEIRTTRVKDSGTIVGLIGRLGGTNPRIERFLLANATDARRRALAAALADARRDAEALAAGAGVKLGGLLSASDGSFSPVVAEDIMVTGSRLMAPPPPPPPPPIAVELSPRPIETQARVTVAYAIAQ
jgi:uncharacterized protein YggE